MENRRRVLHFLVAAVAVAGCDKDDSNSAQTDENESELESLTGLTADGDCVVVTSYASSDSEPTRTTYTYERGQLLRISKPKQDGSTDTTTFTYGDSGQVVRVETDERSNGTVDRASWSEYDEEGRVVGVFYDGGRSSAPDGVADSHTTFEYNPNGRVSSRTYHRSNIVEDFSWDADGRLTQITRTGGFIPGDETVTWNFEDQLIATRRYDRLTGGTITTTYEYNDSSELVRLETSEFGGVSVNPQNSVITYEYDPQGRPTRWVYAGDSRLETTVRYDDRGNVMTYESGSTHKEMTYDGAFEGMVCGIEPELGVLELDPSPPVLPSHY